MPAATAKTPKVRCRLIKTPRPAFPWKIEVLPPHTPDQDTCYFFRTQREARDEIRVRKWQIKKNKSFETIRLIGEFILVTLLLFPLVYKLATDSPIAHLTNPYTALVLSVMTASFMYPVIKLIILMIRGADSTTELAVRAVAYIFFANGFFFSFGSAFSPTIPNASAILADIEKNRAQLVANRIVFPGMTLEEYYATPRIREDGFKLYALHTNNEQWTYMQRKYHQLRARADEEGNKPNDNVHPCKKVLQYAHNLWLERHPESPPRK